MASKENEEGKIKGYDLIVDDLENLDRQTSEPLLVNGQFWKIIVLNKKIDELDGNSCLLLLKRLTGEEDEHSDDEVTNDDNWSDGVIVAGAEIFLMLGRRPEQIFHHECMDPIPFTKGAQCGEPIFQWGKNENSRNVSELHLVINIKTGPLQKFTADEDWLTFGTIEEHEGINNGSDGKYRLTIKKISELVGLSSPKIRIGNFDTNIIIFRKCCPFDVDKHKHGLLFRFVFSHPGHLKKFHKRVIIAVKLVSSEPDVGVESITGEAHLMSPGTIYNMGGFKWELVTDPLLKFIQNDSCVIEVDLNIVEDTKCPLCNVDMKGRQVYSTECNHVLCYDCINEEIQESEKCPKCDEPTSFTRDYVQE